MSDKKLSKSRRKEKELENLIAFGRINLGDWECSVCGGQTFKKHYLGVFFCMDCRQRMDLKQVEEEVKENE